MCFERRTFTSSQKSVSKWRAFIYELDAAEHTVGSNPKWMTRQVFVAQHLFRITLSLCNPSTVGCCECKSISSFSRQLSVSSHPHFSNLLSFKSQRRKSQKKNIPAFWICSSLSSYFSTRITYRGCREKGPRTRQSNSRHLLQNV